MFMKHKEYFQHQLTTLLTLHHNITLCTTAHPPMTIATPITIAVNIAGVESKCKNVYSIIPARLSKICCKLSINFQTFDEMSLT